MTNEGRNTDRERRAWTSWSSILIIAEVQSLGGQTTVQVQWDARKLRGMTEAKMKTWPDYCADLSSKPKRHSTSQTASCCCFFFLPSFLTLQTLQRCMHFIFFEQFLSLILSNSFSRRLFYESGTTDMCKICRGWNNWLRGKGWIMIFKLERIIMTTFFSWSF